MLPLKYYSYAQFKNLIYFYLIRVMTIKFTWKLKQSLIIDLYMECQEMNFWYLKNIFIGKLYLDPIHLSDLGFTRSNPINFGVLMIHLRVAQLALLLTRSNQEPVFWLWSNFKCSNWLWPYFNLIKIQSPDYDATLSAPTDSGLCPRFSLQITI